MGFLNGKMSNKVRVEVEVRVPGVRMWQQGQQNREAALSVIKRDIGRVNVLMKMAINNINILIIMVVAVVVVEEGGKRRPGVVGEVDKIR